VSSVPLTPPFPYFGSKRAVTEIIWQALGDVGVYIEPFLGSAAILLARPSVPKVETVNDADCFLSNFWRALQADPAGVAQWADYPVSELDLHARHRWLMAQEDFREHMRADPDYYDVKLAGWWVWGLCCWIGHGWCVTGHERHLKVPLISGKDHGRGMHKQRPMVGANTPGKGIHKKRPMVAGDRHGNGVHQSLWQVKPAVQAGHVTNGIAGHTDIAPWFTALAARLRRVRICCGDWRRVLTPVVLDGAGHTGIVLDPPYSHNERDTRLYGEDTDLAADVAMWAREHGANPKYRIVLCGYEGEHGMPGWQCLRWQANGGYGNQGTGRGKANAKRECLWLSPHCERVTTQLSLFAGGTP
jgi:DNA adenine methylase